MTRAEQTGKRDLGFSQWIRKNLPDSYTGYSVSDIDFMLWNWKTKKVMILEIKTRMSYPRKGQKMMFSLLNNWLIEGVADNWQYKGLHLIQFKNNESFEKDNICYLNNKEITENELIKFLSLEY